LLVPGRFGRPGFAAFCLGAEEARGDGFHGGNGRISFFWLARGILVGCGACVTVKDFLPRLGDHWTGLTAWSAPATIAF
jgi:hypothetical protein